VPCGPNRTGTGTKPSWDSLVSDPVTLRTYQGACPLVAHPLMREKLPVERTGVRAFFDRDRSQDRRGAGALQERPAIESVLLRHAVCLLARCRAGSRLWGLLAYLN